MNAVREDERVVLRSDVGDITVHSSALDSVDVLPVSREFALWLFLPIAMRLGRELVVEGYGSTTAATRARTLSNVWEGWLPTHFRTVECRFSDGEAPRDAPRERAAVATLMCYSGGADSTYSLLRREEQGEEQDLMTVHGMDYRVHDRARFDDFLKKTAPFAEGRGQRVLVTTDAGTLYKRLECNTRAAFVTHPFTLAGALFLHEGYDHYAIAADCRRDQQFAIWPWGSEAFTNGLYESDRARLETLDDDVVRGEKLDLIRRFPDALRSVTFCVDYASRPHNCGRCAKCVRSKMLFLAVGGSIPEIFNDMGVPADWLGAVAAKRQTHIFLFEIISLARQHGHAHLIPGIDRAADTYRRLRGDPPLTRLIGSSRRTVRKLRRRLRGEPEPGSHGKGAA